MGLWGLAIGGVEDEGFKVEGKLPKGVLGVEVWLGRRESMMGGIQLGLLVSSVCLEQP